MPSRYAAAGVRGSSVSDKGEGRPDRGIVMRSLRAKFSLLAAVLLIAAAGFQYASFQLSINQSINQSIDPSSGSPTVSNSYALLTVLSTLGGFCVAAAVALVVGVIATFLIEATLDRVAVRGQSDVSDESEALAAYGSDPELL